MNSEVVGKIKRLRIAKGFNHLDMADKLHITRSAYQRLESGETYSWAKYLDELMTILDTSPNDFFSDIGKKTINQTNLSGSVGYVVENLYQDNKEITQKLIETKQSEIQFLRELLAKSGGTF
jgi:transcriptional regulator with XRE-family HTH domain